MKVGLHVSIEGGIDNAPGRAFGYGCECFQIFSRSPHGGKEVKIRERMAKKFRDELEKYKLWDFFIHSPYYINFASADNRIRHGSVAAIRDEMRVADLLGAKGVVTHLGSAKGFEKEEAVRRLVKGICRVFEIPSPAGGKHEQKKTRYAKFKTKLLLEITAGAGNIMGDTFEEIAEVISEAEKEIGKDALGVCFDTAHAFASGYDLRSSDAVRRTFRQFDKIIGLNRIKLVHLNDSAAALDSRIDRHANIGKGEIGIEGIKAILQELEPLNLDFVLETPMLRNGNDLEILKKLRREI